MFIFNPEAASTNTFVLIHKYVKCSMHTHLIQLEGTAPYPGRAIAVGSAWGGFRVQRVEPENCASTSLFGDFS